MMNLGKQINDLVMQIVQLSMQLSKDTDYYAFCNIAPHTNQIDIYTTHKSDYRKHLTYDYIYLNFDTINEYTELKTKLERVIYALFRILSNNGLDELSLEKDEIGRNRLATFGGANFE